MKIQTKFKSTKNYSWEVLLQHNIAFIISTRLIRTATVTHSRASVLHPFEKRLSPVFLSLKWCLRDSKTPEIGEVSVLCIVGSTVQENLTKSGSGINPHHKASWC